MFHGSKSIYYLGPIILDILPVTNKKSPCLQTFKNRIKNGNLRTNLEGFGKQQYTWVETVSKKRKDIEPFQQKELESALF